MAGPEDFRITLPEPLAAALDKARAAAGDGSSRDALAAAIVADWLRERGYLREANADEGRRPGELSAENDD